MKVFVIEYRNIKKNVETFGLKHWYEGICLLVETENPLNIKNKKVHLNLGKIQSENNSIQIKTRKGITQTRPSNMFSDLNDLISNGIKQFKEYYNKNLKTTGEQYSLIVFNSNIDGTYIIPDEYKDPIFLYPQ